MMRAILVAAFVVLAAPAGPSHPVAFWRQIVSDKYAAPPGSDPSALTTELLAMLASPDPELRDDIAYSTLATWIYETRVIGDDALRPIVKRLLENLTEGV